MKILISNYSSDSTTEPMYLNTSFNKAGCKSTLLSPNISIYDGFDISKPDVYITHHEHLSGDLIVYLKNNPSKKLDVIVNITGISQENLSKLDSIFNNNGIKPALYFVNCYDSNLRSKTKIISLLHGSDLFLSSEPKRYDIDYGIFIDNKSQVKEMTGSYHYITYYKNIDKISDIYLPVNRLSHLYHNYKKIVFAYFNSIFTQSFFDASVITDSVYFDIEDRSLLKKHLSKLLGDDTLCDLSIEGSGKIKDLIMNKHTCLHRTKSLLSQLPAKEYVDNLQKVIENRGEI